MADLSKLKRRGSLGAPPPLEEASPNLEAPEVAPAAPVPETFPEAGPPPRIDARSLRRMRSSRTLQFATRVSPDFDTRIRKIAIEENLMLVEVLERALDLYERRRKK